MPEVNRLYCVANRLTQANLGRKSEEPKNRRSGRLDKLAQSGISCFLYLVLLLFWFISNSAAKKPQRPKRKGAAQEPMQGLPDI